MDNERWLPIPERLGLGFSGWYEVSDGGRVRSWRKRGRGRGRGRRLEPWVLSLHVDKRGYRRAMLVESGEGLVQERVVVFRVHRLVLEAFVGPCPEGCEGSHLDGDPGNNRLENLVWETSERNNRRKADHGRGGRLSYAQVQELRQSFWEWTVREAARYGVLPDVIRHGIRRQRYRQEPD